MPLARVCAVLFAITLAAGCAKHDAGHDHAPAGGHAHTAPHGGTLVELGEHAYNVELLRDPATGRLSAWILDGHAENFVRIKAASFEATATVAGEKRPLSFKAVANPATGETVGDTSQFEAEAAWLKATPAFEGVIVSLDVRGSRFANVPFALK
jgi:hypothetical protein